MKKFFKRLLHKFIDGFFTSMGFSIIVAIFLLIVYIMDNNESYNNYNYKYIDYNDSITIIDSYLVTSSKYLRIIYIVEDDTSGNLDNLQLSVKVYDNKKFINDLYSSNYRMIDGQRCYVLSSNDIYSDKLDSNITWKYSFDKKIIDTSSVDYN